MRLAVLTLLLVACAGVDVRLNEAAGELRSGHPQAARDTYQSLVGDPDPHVRVRAELGAAHASRALADGEGERSWLERAVAEPSVAGLSVDAEFELAELLRRDGDGPRALNHYYRAATGAQRDAQRQDIYRRAVDAIRALSAAP